MDTHLYHVRRRHPAAPWIPILVHIWTLCFVQVQNVSRRLR